MNIMYRYHRRAAHDIAKLRYRIAFIVIAIVSQRKKIEVVHISK